MHLHTAGNSKCALEMPADIAKLYHQKGYGGIVCTNHFNRHDLDVYMGGKYKLIDDKIQDYLKGYYELKKECEKYGIDVFLGLEASPDFCTYYKLLPPYGEFLIYGITPELLRESGVDILNMDQKELFDWCNQHGLIMIQAHPYRMICTILDERYMHGMEVANLHPGQNSRNDKAEKFASERDFIKTGGSDFHFAGGEGGGIILDRAPVDEKDLVQLLKSGNYQIIRTRE